MVVRQDDSIKLLVTIATTLYKYMHIYLWTALRIGVFERRIYALCTEI